MGKVSRGQTKTTKGGVLWGIAEDAQNVEAEAIGPGDGEATEEVSDSKNQPGGSRNPLNLPVTTNKIGWGLSGFYPPWLCTQHIKN